MIGYLPRDVGGNVIQGLNNIPFVDNFEMTVSGEWVAIQLRTEECKQLICQPRTQVDWKFATASGSSTYFTFRAGAALEASVVTTSGSTLFWVTADELATFELLIGR
jgi:hypothetical protein